MFNPPSDPDVMARLEKEEGGAEVNMHRRLLHYHHHSESLLHCYAKVSKDFNADQPLQDLVTQGKTEL